MPKAVRKSAPVVVPTDVQQFSIGARWIYDGDARLDATSYAQGAFRAMAAIEQLRVEKRAIGDVCGKMWHPVQDQARSNFKRIYTDREHGVPFVSSKDMFMLPLRPNRFLSARMPKLGDLMMPEGWIVVSRSGTIGNILYISRTIGQCAISDHAIRIEPREIEGGYLYAFLSTRAGQELIVKDAYGGTVSQIEPKHLASIRFPLGSDAMRDDVHEKIVAAYRLRDEVNDLISQADAQFHALLGLRPFSDADVEYMHGAARAFTVRASALSSDRLDAAHHLPIVPTVLRLLKGGRYPLTTVEKLCSHIEIPPRFKRRYASRDHGVPYLLPAQLVAMRAHGLKAISARQAATSPEYLLTEGHLLLTTDGTVGRVHPVTRRMAGWFGSNNMVRLWDEKTDLGFLYVFLSTPYGVHQVCREIYGGVVDHIDESHVKGVWCPDVPPNVQHTIGDLVRVAFAKKDEANDLEDAAIQSVEAFIAGVSIQEYQDQQVARRRIAEIAADPTEVVRGEELARRMDALI